MKKENDHKLEELGRRVKAPVEKPDQTEGTRDDPRPQKEQQEKGRTKAL